MRRTVIAIGQSSRLFENSTLLKKMGGVFKTVEHASSLFWLLPFGSLENCQCLRAFAHYKVENREVGGEG